MCEGTPLGPAGVGEVVAVPAGRDSDAARGPPRAGAEGRMVPDGALEGAVDAARIGDADGARASLVEGWNGQADVGAHDEWGDWLPEEPAGPWGLAGRGRPGLGAWGRRGRGRGQRHVGRRWRPREDLLGNSGGLRVLKAGSQ